MPTGLKSQRNVLRTYLLNPESGRTRSWSRIGLTATLLVTQLAASSCTILERACSQPEVICAGLVTGYGSVGTGIEQQAWLALQDARASRILDRVDYIETRDTRDRAANIAYFADAGYDIIVTTGAGISTETIDAAAQHGNALFVLVQPAHESMKVPANVVKLEFKEERGGFLAGAAAAMITRTRRVAAVCEARFIDYVERYCEGFAAGADFIDPQVETAVVYRGGPEESLFQDAEWGEATAARAIDDGADVVFAVGEATARGALLQAARQGALVIAAQSDAYDETPQIRDQLVTSAIVQVREELGSLISQHLRGQLPDASYLGNMGLTPFRDDHGRLPAGLEAELVEIEGRLNGGTLETHLPFGSQ